MNSNATRTKEIKIRVSDDEYQKLLERKEGTLASWIRSVCLEEPIAEPYKKCDPDFLFNMGRIGGNLNQISKQVNTLNSQPFEQIKSLAQLSVIREQLDHLLRMHDDS